MAIDTVSASRTFIASGKLKALAGTSLQESALLPGIKTVAAQGVGGFQVVAWMGSTPLAVRRLRWCRS